MKYTRVSRWIVSAVVVALALPGALSFYAHAQSEYLRTDRMPYEAFDKLPKIDLEVPGGVVHVAFAPMAGCLAASSGAGAREAREAMNA